VTTAAAETTADAPALPRKAAGCFFLFVNGIRAGLMAQGLGTTALAVEAGRLWKELTPEKRQEWNLLAQSEKDRYAREVVAYQALVPGWQPPARKSNKRSRQDEAPPAQPGRSTPWATVNGTAPSNPHTDSQAGPKRGPTAAAAAKPMVPPPARDPILEAAAFLWFAEEQRQELGAHRCRSLAAAKRLATMWKRLPATEKAPIYATLQRARVVLQEATETVAARPLESSVLPNAGAPPAPAPVVVPDPVPTVAFPPAVSSSSCEL
jgi:hypothetical protein